MNKSTNCKCSYSNKYRVYRFRYSSCWYCWLTTTWLTSITKHTQLTLTTFLLLWTVRFIQTLKTWLRSMLSRRISYPIIKSLIQIKAPLGHHRTFQILIWKPPSIQYLINKFVKKLSQLVTWTGHGNLSLWTANGNNSKVSTVYSSSTTTRHTRLVKRILLRSLRFWQAM